MKIFSSTFHNLIAHPIMELTFISGEVLRKIGFPKQADRLANFGVILHDRTVPPQVK